VSFQDAVAHLVDACPGAVGAAIVDPEGIPVVIEPRDAELEDVGAEFATIVREVEQAERELQHGTLQQFTVYAEDAALVVTLMSGGYYLVLQLEPTGLLGKGRFLSRVVGEQLYSEFI